MHDAAAVQVTAFSSLNCAPGGTGAGWMRHRAPAHRSTRSFEFEVPTAVQVSVAGHATPDSLLDGDRAGLGVDWMRQLLPFHRSARVRCAPDLAANCPTAVHAEPDEQDTPLRALAAAPAGFGVDWTVQAPPLRRSASVTPRPDSRTCNPTAMHTAVAGQDTAVSTPFPARGFGLAVIDHPRTGALADAAGVTPACAAAPAAGPSSTIAAPKATTARRNGPRIATPPLSPRRHAARRRGRPWINRQQHQPRGSSCAEDLVLPALCGQSVARRSDQRQRSTCKFVLDLPWLWPWLAFMSPRRLLRDRARSHASLPPARYLRRAVIARGANMRSLCALTRANSMGPPPVHTRQREVELRTGVTLRNSCPSNSIPDPVTGANRGRHRATPSDVQPPLSQAI